MGLWIKNADGTIERTAGGGADGQPGVDGVDGQPGADGNMWHVGSGAPASTLGEPGDYYLDGEDGWVYLKRNDGSWTNLYVNLTGPPGADGGGGDLTWPLLAPDGTRFAPSYSFSTNGASGTYLAADGSVRIAAEGTDAIGFDSRYITLGGQQQGVGRMSILSGSSGSPVYGFEGDIGTGIYRAAAGVLGFSTGGVERLRVGSSLTFKGDMQVDGVASMEYASLGGVVMQGFYVSVKARSAEYIEWSAGTAFGQIQLLGNTVSTTGSALLHYRSNQGYTVESGKRLRTPDGTPFQDCGPDMVANTTAPTGTTYPGGHLTVVPHDAGDGKYRLYIENNTDADRAWVGMWTGTMPIFGRSAGVASSVTEIAELSARIETLEGQTRPIK